MSALALAYDELEQHAESDSLYEEALKIREEDPLLMNNYSYSLSERGENLSYALELSQKAVAQDSTNGAYLDTLGWIHFKLGNYNRALQYIKKSLQTNRESAEVLEHLGDVYNKLNDTENAKKYWQKSLELDDSRTWIIDKLESLK